VLEEFEDTKGAIRIHKEKFEDTTAVIRSKVLLVTVFNCNLKTRVTHDNMFTNFDNIYI
jgi:hypothetical protein